MVLTLGGSALAKKPNRNRFDIFTKRPQNGFVLVDPAEQEDNKPLRLGHDSPDVVELRTDPPHEVEDFSVLEFRLKGGKPEEHDIALEVEDHAGAVRAVLVSDYARGHKGWQWVRVPIDDLGVYGGIRAVRLRNLSSRNESPTWQVEKIKLLRHEGSWLHTEENRILTSKDKRWRGRGASVQDTRSCGACLGQEDPEEVIRRIDELVDSWGANFVRLTLESHDTPSLLDDRRYFEDIRRIVHHVGRKDGVYIMISLWHDPTFSKKGWPTDATLPIWEKLAETFADDPYVIFGICNEPQANFDGELDADVWEAMDNAVAAIRSVEAAHGKHKHLISVQGTGGWARDLHYYIGRPIEAGDGENIVYELHYYDAIDDVANTLEDPAGVLPVIIGEFGPVRGSMNAAECNDLMSKAEALDIPYLAWTFHQRCDPSMLVDNSGGGCGIGMKLEPSPWGEMVRSRFQMKWGDDPYNDDDED
ncbi:MAG TPA: cellulase family glycosylhydrolase [Myxococcota bacterium]|nr:cellulase family glycosylhydrolase [Myxococcota bacterium]